MAMKTPALPSSSTSALRGMVSAFGLRINRQLTREYIPGFSR